MAEPTQQDANVDPIVESGVTNKPLSDLDIERKIDAIDDKKAEEPAEKKNESVEETKETDEAVQSDEAGTDETDAKEDEGSEGYTIDEGEEEEEASEPDTSNAQVDTSNLNPEQQYILDNLKPITVRGYEAGSDKIKTFEVYAPEQLPQGFKYADERELSIANKEFGILENKAQQLQTEYRNQTSQKAVQEFQERENRADRQDIAELQREGEIPMFKADPDSKNFEDDPGVKLTQDVLDFKEEMNRKYMDEYNAGRPYRHIGFTEAFRLYKAQNPTKGNPEQVKEDNERKGIAKRTANAGGNPAQKPAERSRIRPNMSSRDLDAYLDRVTSNWEL